MNLRVRDIREPRPPRPGSDDRTIGVTLLVVSRVGRRGLGVGDRAAVMRYAADADALVATLRGLPQVPGRDDATPTDLGASPLRVKLCFATPRGRPQVPTR